MFMGNLNKKCNMWILFFLLYAVLIYQETIGIIKLLVKGENSMTNDTKTQELDIYDFDKTMIPFDSGSRFWMFCLLHYPWILLLAPYQFFAAFLYILHIFDLTQMKGPFFAFIRFIPLEKAVKKFWDKHEKDVFDWARKENRERYSVMISASPDFLISEIASRIQIDDYICTRHGKSGKIIGKNCHDAEKVRLFREKYPEVRVINVYSDSIKNDKYIFSLAENCYNTVKGEKIPFRFEMMYPAEAK